MLKYEALKKNDIFTFCRTNYESCHVAISNDTLLMNFNQIGLVVFPKAYLQAKDTLPTGWWQLSQNWTTVLCMVTQHCNPVKASSAGAPC